ncbi:MFS transporter [Fodinisporobacter ferrooxydans]|uniref:MFS transporter n=1 Tax=Fodinisporobacter ferrooxydans TaxID=2901836 RepID=A0ABY4CIV0_9BACL|nr:MFS transporter [Alicyclobacillaceae bacterium MYW30-H2]
MQTNAKRSFFRYENGIVLMMFFTFGFVFMERLSVVFLFPFIAPDLKLNNGQIGLIVSMLSICWAISGWVFGSISDISGSRKKVLLPITLLFSLFSFLSGLTKSFVTMVLIRGLMGLSEGPVLPIAQASVIADSSPERRGFNLGFVQSSIGLIGATLTPILVTAFATRYSWHSAFYLVGIPGIIMFFILFKYMKEPKLSADNGHVHERSGFKEFTIVYRNRNTWICTIISAFFMAWLFVFTTFAPIYLTTVDKFKPEEMGLIMAAIGFGSFVWGFVGPAISDKFGRKPTLIVFSLIAALSPLCFAVIHGSVAVMMLLGFLTTVGQGCFPLFMAVIPGESLPFKYAASAVAMTQLVGELVGGTIAPSIAGFAADSFGLQAPLWIAFAGALISGFVAFGLKETAPAKVMALHVGKDALSME